MASESHGEYHRAYALDGTGCVIAGPVDPIATAIALAFAREGAHVAVLCTEDDGQGLGEAFAASGLVAPLVLTGTDSEAALDRIAQTQGVPSVLINCHVANGESEALDQQAWDRAIGGQLGAAYRFATTFGQSLRGRPEGGAIVNVTSIAAEQPDAALGAFSVAAAGLRMLSRLLAANLGPDGLRSNAVLHGLIDKVAPGDARADEVAQAVLFLASGRAGYMNGAEIRVDGGLATDLIGLVPRHD